MKVSATATLFFLLLTGCQPAAEKSPLSHWQIPGGLIIDAALSDKGNYAALLYGDNSLAVWNSDEQHEVSRWSSETVLRKTRLVTLSDGGGFVLTASDEGVQVWNINQTDPLGTLPLAAYLGDATVTAIAFWRAPSRFVVGTSRGTVPIPLIILTGLTSLILQMSPVLLSLATV